MELKRCPRCGKDVHPLSKTCPYCNLSFENDAALSQEQSEQEPMLDIVFDGEQEGEPDYIDGQDTVEDYEEQYDTAPEYDEDEAVFYNDGADAAQMRRAQKKRRMIMIGGAAGGVALLVLIVTLVLVLRPTAYTRAQNSLKQENYIDALSYIENKSGEKAENLRERIYGAMQNQIGALIDQNNYERAGTLLEQYDDALPDNMYDALRARLQNRCTHQYETWVLEEASCEKGGSEQEVCRICGKTQSVQVSPASHTFESKKRTEPTCEDKGEEVRTCKKCGKTETEALPALGHDLGSEADCESGGKCKRCGKTVGQALGHEVGEPADCEHASVCKRCGKEITAALGHDYAEATCTTPKTCKRCDQTVGKALGHDFTVADCVRPKTCRQCGIEEGEPLGHRYVEGSCVRCEKPDPAAQTKPTEPSTSSSTPEDATDTASEDTKE